MTIMNYEAQLAAHGLKATSGSRRLAAVAMSGGSLKAQSKEGTFELSFKDGQLIVTKLPDGTVCSSPVMLMSIAMIPAASLTPCPFNKRG
jgi:hypothetical protein